MGFIGKTNSSLSNKSTPYSMADALPVQTKLTVSKASDPAEKEADTMARKVADEQKDKKANTRKAEDKKEQAPIPTAEPTPEPKKEGVKSKEDKDVKKSEAPKEEKKADKKEDDKKDKVSKQDDKKQDVKKKSTEKEEKKADKKEDDKKDKVSKQDDKKQDVKKKGTEKEEKKADKKEGDKKEKVSKQDDKKQDVKKKGTEKEEPKAAKKTDQNKDKKPVDQEKDSNAKPKSIHRKESGTRQDKPAIQQKPQQVTPVSALGRKESKTGGEPTQQSDEEGDETKLQAIEEKINAKKGSGRPLPDQSKADMEQSFQYDFSDVRIHDDKESQELCASLNAQAFAIGNDIFFNSGKYDPESDKGRELLAHELTHVVQQKDHVQRMNVHRKAAAASASGIDEASKTITIDKLKIPKLKSRNRSKIDGSIKRPRNYARDAALAQDQKWKDDVQPQVAAKVKDKIKGAPLDPDTNVYYLGLGKIKLFGSEAKIVENARVPLWSKSGKASAYDVDHIKEMQLGGTNDPKSNMELLNFSANRSSGSIIKTGIRDSISDFLEDEKKKDPAKKLPTVETALKSYDITFTSAEYKLDVGGDGNDFWSYNEITSGEHLDKFKPLTVKEIEEVKGSPLHPIVYTSEAGGSGLKEPDFKSLPGLSVTGFDFKNPAGEVTGRINGTILPNSKIVKPYAFTLNAYKTEGVLHGGHIKRRASGEGSLEKLLSRLEVQGLSPIVVDFVDLVPGKGIMAKGRIVPTVKMIEGVEIDFTIEGDKIELSKTFSAGEIKSVPPPFKINDAALTVFAGSRGIGVKGNIDFEITNVGTGKITGSGKSDGVFQLEGKFEFDKKIFNKAEVEMKYTHVVGGDDQWEVKGNIQIPKGKIKGVKKAEITVGYDGTTLNANGTADFDIPGIEHGKLDVTYGNEQMVIQGEVDLKHKFIKSGKVSAKVEKAGEEYKVSLSGNAKPNIPGVDTDLSVSYLEGVITITGTVGYNKGRLSGTATVGVTNQAVGADGKPSGGPGKDLSVFGGGSLTLKITDWLQGTAGITFKPDGNIEVIGKIGIPAAVDIFPKKEIKKEIFKAPTLEIPLFAIPVGPRSIGLVATIGGGAEAYASIGPGQLTDASVEVKYNPAEEENMSVTGTAKFRVPAEAGLRLFIRAGIGLSIGIARVSGGIELGGSLGIEGAAEAGVTVNWSPAQGFKLDAEASLSVQPKFKFDVNAYVEAVLDLWIKEFSKEWKWNLYAFEWGPAMKFGVKFPVHYEENKPFDISLDDVQFEAPDISVGDFAKGIGKQLFD